MKQSPPTHRTVAGRSYLALRAKARADGRGTQELLQLFALESFVDRLSSSPRAEDLILKGGVLLSAYDVRRPTRDVDLTAQHLPNDPERVRELIAQVLAELRADGWIYSVISADVIRDAEAYSGVRVTVQGELASARVTFHVDVNVGDVVWPPADVVVVPRLLGGSISVRGYPLSMVLAEKLVTTVQRGTANTRWRDFADVYLLSGKHALHAEHVRESIRRVGEYRRAVLAPLSSVLIDYASLAQTRWAAWVRKQNLSDRLPTTFGAVLAEVQQFADPLMSSGSAASAWIPRTRQWD